MTRLNISSPKLARIDAKQKYDAKIRSGTSRFARATMTGAGTPTRNPTRGILPTVNINNPRSQLSLVRGDIAERGGIKFGQSSEGRALASNGTVRSHRGVSTIWKNGLALESTTTTRSHVHIGRNETENEDNRSENDDDSNQGSENEHSDEIWGDERTLIDDLMGFDDHVAHLSAYIRSRASSIHDKTKRQEALTDALKAHFSSLSISIRQDLLDGVAPVIDNLATTIAILRKGPDNEYQDGLTAFNQTAQNAIDTNLSLTEQFGELKDQSLVSSAYVSPYAIPLSTPSPPHPHPQTCLKSIVGRIETERACRTELCQSFKAQYREICSRIQERLARAAGEDMDRAAMVAESRANALINGKDKDKAKMRQKILKAFA
ncbi:hypothetical protein RhiXN_02244 [Rhizoctonia solani]|uniref:Uncharacterized protein n=1 Tax=Rhizoctonia solani TaxID=456999 RepID=A0A8H8P8U1_9AGAM|nr:uncharacterized protein RhiXN_02244 [Rhizoctonia solani]QRW27649.1 hypothetical protein RhiXN_02244 [Rhizoctonia solani]